MPISEARITRELFFDFVETLLSEMSPRLRVALVQDLHARCERKADAPVSVRSPDAKAVHEAALGVLREHMAKLIRP